MTFESFQRIQARRDFPTRATQRLQLTMQNAIIAPTLAATGKVKPPLLLRLLTGVPFLSRIPARLLGLGFRPEHVAAPIRAGKGV